MKFCGSLIFNVYTGWWEKLFSFGCQDPDNGPGYGNGKYSQGNVEDDVTLPGFDHQG